MNLLEQAIRQVDFLDEEDSVKFKNILNFINGEYNDNDFQHFLNYINEIRVNGVVEPLTLEYYNFTENIKENALLNENYPYIELKLSTDDEQLDKIINNNAFNITINSVYDVETKTFEKRCNVINCQTLRLYINKGGIITGHYIDKFYIKDEIINKHNFIPTIINVPVVLIIDGNKCYYCVDCRHSSLKELATMYDYEIKMDEEVKNKKYKLRKTK